MSKDFQPGDSIDIPSSTSGSKLFLSLDLNEADAGEVAVTIIDAGAPAAQLFVNIAEIRTALDTMEGTAPKPATLDSASIAAAIQLEREAFGQNDRDMDEALYALDEIAGRLAELLPEADRAAFLRACGVQS